MTRSSKQHHNRKTLKTPKTQASKKMKWKDMKPHTTTEKLKMKRKYNSKCFLEPTEMKYPICNKFDGNVECKGIYAAEYYVNIHKSKKVKPIMKYKKLHKKIQTLKRRHKCGKFATGR